MECEDIIIFRGQINANMAALFVQTDKDQIMICSEQTIAEFKQHIINFKPSIST